MVALTKDNSKANIAGVVDTINKRVSGKFTLQKLSFKEKRMRDLDLDLDQEKKIRDPNKLFVLGKNWKIQKNATVRNQQPKILRKNWEQRTKERQRHASAKNLENSMKAEKQAEKDVSIKRKS